MWTPPTWFKVLRDLVCLAVGGWGVIHEELSGHPSPTVLAVYAVMMVSPGVLAAGWLAREGTGGQSSPPPGDSPPPPSSSQPSSTSG